MSSRSESFMAAAAMAGIAAALFWFGTEAHAQDSATAKRGATASSNAADLAKDLANPVWTVPIYAVVSKVTRLGDQVVSFGAGVRYWADSPDSGPHGWGFRLVLTWLFPR